MGQQEIEKLTHEEYYSRSEKELLRQADLYYINKKFAVETEFDKYKLRHAQLYQKLLCTDNCEVIKWVNKKIRGALDNSNITIVDIPTMQTKYRDINITNIYNTSVNDLWENTVEW